MATRQVIFEQTGANYECRTGEGIFQLLARNGSPGLPRGCTSGGCGVCKVRIIDGLVEALGFMSKAHISDQEAFDGFVLGCRVTPQTDVNVELVGKLKHLLLDRKS